MDQNLVNAIHGLAHSIERATEQRRHEHDSNTRMLDEVLKQSERITLRVERAARDLRHLNKQN